MDSSKHFRLGDLQLRIMRIVWKHREVTAVLVHSELGGTAEFAFTTIATMLRKMEGRGLLSHREEGRAFVYRSEVSESEVSQSMSTELVKKLFGGSLSVALNHLLSSREVSRAELKELEKIIAERKKKP